jgi:hypothetical protein
MAEEQPEKYRYIANKLELLNSLIAELEWIDVSDLLPTHVLGDYDINEIQPVLILYHLKSDLLSHEDRASEQLWPGLARYHEKLKKWYIETILDEDWESNDIECNSNVIVRYWMRVPEPPKNKLFANPCCVCNHTASIYDKTERDIAEGKIKIIVVCDNEECNSLKENIFYQSREDAINGWNKFNHLKK